MPPRVNRSTRPHEIPPLTVVDDSSPLPEREHRTYESSMRVSDLLAEPSPRTGEWVCGVIRRLIACSTGPVAVEVRDPEKRARLEAAGWFVATGDADLAEARHACWPLLPTVRRIGLGAGSPHPKLVLVGQKVNRAGQVPFASRSGTWLFATMRLMGYDELSCYVANALDSRGRRYLKRMRLLYEAFLPTEARWVALGTEARDLLTKLDIPHVYVEHPAWHKRYKHSEGVAGYAKRLRSAGLEDAPGAPFVPPETGSLPELGEPYAIRSVAFARGTGTGGATTKARPGGKPGAAKLQQVRQLYVMGKAESVAEACRIVGVKSTGHFYAVARDEGWKAEREDYHRTLTERMKDAAQDAEAKALAQARKLSVVAMHRGLAQVAKRLGLDETHPQHLVLRPSDCLALARVWELIEQGGAGLTDPQREEIARLPIEEILRRARDQVKRGLGGE